MRLTFENPQAFWLLTLLPVFIVLKVLADTRARHAVTRLASPRLLDGLLVSKGTGRAWVIFSLELFALAMFAAAMARPQYGSVKEEVKSSGRSLIIAIDASKSMLAQDVKPSRLERAQFAAEDLVRQLSKDRIGLMQFAGTANMLAPFTNDTDAVQEIIQSIDPEGVALGGSNLANAIDYAIDVFHHADLSGQQAMVIFSDGEELQGEALAAARRARDAQIAIISVAVGTAAGELIPDSGTPGGFLKDRNNKPVMTRLHKEVLQQIAEITGGLYLALDGQSVSNSRIETILRKLQRSDMKSKTIETNVDRFRWPLAAGLLSLVAAFLTGIVRRHQSAIRGTALAAAAAALFFMSPVPAQGAEDDGDTAEETTAKKKEEEKTVDGDPWFFYAQGDWKNAVANFAVAAAGAHSDPEIDRVQMGLGAAAFKAATSDPKKFDSGMIEQAIEAFGTALASNNPDILEAAHYNLANSIYERAKAAEVEREAAFQKAKNKKAKKKYAPTAKYIDHVIRQLENSLEHYQESLAFNGTNKDAAKKNMDKVAALVETLRDIRKGKDKEEQQAQGKGEGEEGEGEGQEGEGEGDGEGQSKGKGKGKGKGKAKGQGQGSGDEEGEDGDSEGEGDGKGENEGKGKGDKDGDGKGGDDKSKDGDGAGANDKSNKEFDGKLKANGDGGNHDGEGDKDGKNGEGEKPGSSGEVARKQALQKLQNLSGELPPRARSGSVQERRPAKDW